MPDSQLTPVITTFSKALRVIGAVASSLLLCWFWLSAVVTSPPVEDDMTKPVWRPSQRVVMLGNSMVKYGIDELLLTEDLDLEGEVQVVAVPGTAMPSTLAIMAAGLESSAPDLIVIGFRPRDLVDTSAPDGKIFTSIERVTGLSASTISKALDRGGLWEAFRGDRERVRQALLDGTRNGSLGLILGDGDGDLCEQGARVAETTLSEVFADDRVNIDTHRRVLPVAATRSRAAEESDAFDPVILQRLGELAAEHSSRVVIVRMPCRAQGCRDELSLDEHRSLIDVLKNNDLGYIDLSTAELEANVFVDSIHLGKLGMEQLTRILSSRLRPFLAGELTVDELPEFPRKVDRRGSPKVDLTVGEPRPSSGCRTLLPVRAPAGLSDIELGRLNKGAVSPFIAFEDGVALSRQLHAGCSGVQSHLSEGLSVAPFGDSPGQFEIRLNENLDLEARSYWALPGQRLVIDFETAMEKDDVPVRIAGLRIGPGAVDLTINGRSLRLEDRTINRVELFIDASAGLELSIQSDDDTFFLLQALTIADRPTSIGRPADFEAASISMIPASSGIMPAFEPTQAQAPAVSEVIPGDRPDTLSLKVDLPVSLAKRVLAERLGAKNCSPFRVLMDDEITLDRALSANSFSASPGSSYQGPIQTFKVSTPSGDPAEDHSFAITLKADRRGNKKHGLWLYPGDRATLRLTKNLFLRAPDGVSAWAARATILGDGDLSGALEVTVHGAEGAETTTFPLAALDSGPAMIALSRRWPAKQLQLRIENNSDRYLFMQKLSLIDRIED